MTWVSVRRCGARADRLARLISRRHLELIRVFEPWQSPFAQGSSAALVRSGYASGLHLSAWAAAAKNASRCSHISVSELARLRAHWAELNVGPWCLYAI